jgi:hypothetical protein
MPAHPFKRQAGVRPLGRARRQPRAWRACAFRGSARQHDGAGRTLAALAFAPNAAARFRGAVATIAFLKSDRPDGPGADDPYGDDALVRIRR